MSGGEFELTGGFWVDHGRGRPKRNVPSLIDVAERELEGINENVTFPIPKALNQA